jgi:hypothetical protein
MRIRTDHFAARAETGWTSDAMHAARQQANQLTRPQGYQAPTPDQRWANRLPIDNTQRQQLAAAIARYRQQAITKRGDDFDPHNRLHQRQVHRQAVRQALLELGLLTTTTRSIPLPLHRKKRDMIS